MQVIVLLDWWWRWGLIAVRLVGDDQILEWQWTYKWAFPVWLTFSRETVWIFNRALILKTWVEPDGWLSMHSWSDISLYFRSTKFDSNSSWVRSLNCRKGGNVNNWQYRDYLSTGAILSHRSFLTVCTRCRTCTVVIRYSMTCQYDEIAEGVTPLDNCRFGLTVI